MQWTQSSRAKGWRTGQTLGKPPTDGTHLSGPTACPNKETKEIYILKGTLARLIVSENNTQKVQDTIQTHSTHKMLGKSDQFTRKTTNNRDQSKTILKLMKIF